MTGKINYACGFCFHRVFKRTVDYLGELSVGLAAQLLQ